jgi:hypothetical protein
VPFNRYVIMSQKPARFSLVADGTSSGFLIPIYMPAATVARTPDPPSDSGRRYARKGVRIETVTSTRASEMRSRNFAAIHPTAKP